MFIIREDDKRFLAEYIPDIDRWVAADDLRGLMEELSIAMMKVGFDCYEDGPNEIGRQIERINDRLYYDNQTQE